MGRPLETKTPLKKIYIGALFPMNGTAGWVGGQGCLPAAQMALEDVNKDLTLLSGYELDLNWNNSQCDPGLAATILYDLIYRPPKKPIILGGCSIVCSGIAETAKMYNLVVVGYGSSSPALSNRYRFPTFFRTHPSATIHNPTRVKLFKKFRWSRISIILEAEEVFVTTGKDLETRCKEADIEILTRVSFLDDPTEAVKSLSRQGARIIIGMFYAEPARKVMCEAYKAGLFGKQYVWFLIGWYDPSWFHPTPNINCTMNEMRKVVEGHFTTEALMINQGYDKTIAGITAQEWVVRYENELKKYKQYFPFGSNKPQEGSQEAPLAYDAIWAIALALNKTIAILSQKGLSLDSFDYESPTVMNVIKSELQKVQFPGVSGYVAFNDIGDRISWTLIEQMVDGEYRKLGYYDTVTDNLTWIDKEVWIVGGRPPKDRTEVVQSLQTVNNALFISLSVVSAIGILMAVSLICFNYRFSNCRYIQMSNPATNNLMLIGCILCFISVVLFGLGGQDVGGLHNVLIVCNARAFCLSIGFSLFFGAMFAKIWYCHLLHTQSKRKEINIYLQKINNNHIYIMILGFCSIDLIILSVWFLKDPIKMDVKTFPLMDPDINVDEDIKIQPCIEHCEANFLWYGILFGYKGLLLLFGLFLSYETRSVKLKQLNDSRLVGMSIYNVVILCLITGPVSQVIEDQVNAHFAFIALAIIFCCFLTMALVFVPKIVELVRIRSGPNSGINGSGINGTFHETMTSREEEERFNRLSLENQELKEKISEKEKQIEEIKSKIEVMAKQQQELRKSEESKQLCVKRKAVRIQEPDGQDGDVIEQLSNTNVDPVSDSGFVSNRNSRPSDFEFSESYL
ncbi:gamma-aminobutyric acid type B receptor subunit 1-like [Oppia nitens]|uniref:gamma-aminobutyric acid type B receptor subunit 1-like n=1 Tax=Oppia nitens TaxID=1686743 RepID=UPI0023DBA468|nr:gamma-aminobutyric acid type B receptor subunit 1-like [Oppia nitens]